LSDITVVGSVAADFTGSFIGDDGKRDQATLEVVDNNLTDGGLAVDFDVAVTTEGRGESGIEVVNENCAELLIKVSESDVNAMKTGENQDMDLVIRIGAKDLNIPPILERLCVKESNI